MSDRSATPTRRALLAGGPLVLTGLGSRARAAEPLRLGVLTDISSFGRDTNGPGSVEAVHMAVAEFGPSVLGRPIEILVADHQEKVDVGTQIARKWFDEDGVLAIIDVPNSAIGIGVHNLARDKGRIALLAGTFASDVTNQLCSPNTVQMGLDTYAMGHVLARSLLADGARTWFFITADFAFGAALQADATDAIVKGGGTVVGAAKHPPITSDFSSFLLEAQSSGADVIAFANSAGDTTNSLKQAAEFGLVGGKQKLAVFLMFETVIKTVGLQATQGVYAPIWSYWDTDDRTRAWSKAFFGKIGRDADRRADGQLQRHPPLPQSHGCSGYGRHAGRDGGDAQPSDRGRLHLQRPAAGGRAGREGHRPGAHQVAGAIERRLGPDRDPEDHPRRPELPPGKREPLRPAAFLKDPPSCQPEQSTSRRRARPCRRWPGFGKAWNRQPTSSCAAAPGAVFATHGAARFRIIINIGGPTVESTAKFNAAFGIEPSLFWSYYITSLELVGGLLLIVGLLTRPVAVLLSAFLLVATVYVTPNFGFWARENGFEYSLVLLLLILYILARGGGPLSLDRRLGVEI